MEKHTAGMCLFCSLLEVTLVFSFLEVSAECCAVNVIITFRRKIGMWDLQMEGPEHATCFSFSQANSHIPTKLIAEMVLETPKFKFPAMSILPRHKGSLLSHWFHQLGDTLHISKYQMDFRAIYSCPKKLQKSNQTSDGMKAKPFFNAAWLQRDCQAQ